MMRLLQLSLVLITAAPAVAQPLPPAERLAAARAADFIVKGGVIYNECEQVAEAFAVEQVDLNGDGRPELIASDSSGCYGGAGMRFAVLARRGAGFASLFSAVGMPNVLKTATRGWRDIEVGGPGMGRMPVARWNGTAYALP